MDAKPILKKIIENDGCCDWVVMDNVIKNTHEAIKACKACPMSKLRKKPNGDYYSCYEAICDSGVNLDKSTIDKRYLEMAKKILLDISVDEELGIND